jgi:hypothetical protein
MSLVSQMSDPQINARRERPGYEEEGHSWGCEMRRSPGSDPVAANHLHINTTEAERP